MYRLRLYKRGQVSPPDVIRTREAGRVAGKTDNKREIPPRPAPIKYAARAADARPLDVGELARVRAR